MIPFGLSNALAGFYNYINKILVKKPDIFVIVYLDNIFIYTKDLGQAHNDDVQYVLQKLRKHGFLANLKKCWFYNKEVCFLGYIVSAQKI